MGTFVVRLIDGGEYVGIVSCEDPINMPRIIDEFIDPGACEYAELPDGMIFARDGAPDVPDEMDHDEDKESEDYIAGSKYCEDWASALSGGGTLIWEPVTGLADDDWYDSLAGTVLADPPMRQPLKLRIVNSQDDKPTPR